MGKIITTLTITNRLDEGLAKRGAIAPREIRSITLTHVLVETGATTLSLPADVIDALR